MANIIKRLPGLENGSIQFNRINTTPEEYTNVHTVLFNGDQEGFEITTDSSGGFTKLVDSVSIDWQGAWMPRTAELLGLVNGISLNNTAQLIDIIERICAKLNDGGIPEPSEPTIVSIYTDSTDIPIDYLDTFIPVIKATYSDAQNRQLENSLFNWEISEADSTVISQNDDTKVVTGIKAGNASLIATLKEDNTKSITFNINVNKIDISRTIPDIPDKQIDWAYDGTTPIKQNITLKWKTETLVENTDYTVTYSNNIGNFEHDVTAEITFTGIGDNYEDIRTESFTIKRPNRENPTISWSLTEYTAVIGNENNNFPTLSCSPNTLEITYSSSNEEVATIDNNGIITLVHDGETVISAIFAGNNKYNAKTVTYTLTVQPAAVIPEYYWYCGPISESGENMIEISENTYIPTIESNFIDESEQLSKLPGWRKIDMNSNSNYIYNDRERGDYTIYLDGWDENGKPAYKLIPTIIALPVDCNLAIKNGVNPDYYPIDKTILYNGISYNIYKFNIDEFILLVIKI